MQVRYHCKFHWPRMVLLVSMLTVTALVVWAAVARSSARHVMKAWPHAECEVPIHDFGTITERRELAAEFTIVNGGAVELVLRSRK